MGCGGNGGYCGSGYSPQTFGCGGTSIRYGAYCGASQSITVDRAPKSVRPDESYDKFGNKYETCPNCGTHYRNQTKYCAECGAKFKRST